jgi:CHAD domain-containing protein
MWIDSLLNKYFFYQFNRFENYLHQARKEINNEVIHELRVSLKKLRAVHQFCCWAAPQGAKGVKFPNALKTIFKKAGKLRDLHIQFELAGNYKELKNFDTDVYFYYLSFLEKSANHSFKLALKNGKPAIIEKSRKALYKLVKLNHKVDLQKKIPEFIKERILESIELAHKPGKEDNIHEIRRNLKVCYYMTEVLLMNDKVEPTVLITSRKLKELSTISGNWHDKEIMKEMLIEMLELIENKKNEQFVRYLDLIEFVTRENQKVLKNFVYRINKELKIDLSKI